MTTENKSLYSIDESLRDLLGQAADNAEDMTPEQTDEWLAQFEENNLDRKDKIDNILDYIKNEDAWEMGLALEIDRLTERRKSVQLKKANLLRYLQLSMKNAGEGELKTNKHILKFSKNPPSMKLMDGIELNKMQELRIPIHQGALADAKAKLADWKKDMKADLKLGKEIEGAWLERGEKFTVK